MPPLTVPLLTKRLACRSRSSPFAVGVRVECSARVDEDLAAGAAHQVAAAIVQQTAVVDGDRAIVRSPGNIQRRGIAHGDCAAAGVGTALAAQIGIAVGNDLAGVCYVAEGGGSAFLEHGVAIDRGGVQVVAGAGQESLGAWPAEETAVEGGVLVLHVSARRGMHGVRR